LAHLKRANKEDVHSVWLICRAVLGKGRNKLLVRGIKGAEWVFCPLVKSIKNDRANTDQCQVCKHFIRIEQTCIPQTYTKKNPFFFRMLTPPSKDTFHIVRTLRTSKTIHSRVPPFSHIPSLTKERQPLVDVFEEEDYLIVSAELPGIDEKDVNIKADENTITITAENGVKKYLRKIWLPTSIKKDTIKSTYRNNILQVKLEKLNTTKHD
jgi:HSP20 family molecular chaperone IbpA